MNKNQTNQPNIFSDWWKQLHSARKQSFDAVITPEIAKALLDSSKGNRPINARSVLYYAEMMKSGNWGSTHQSIGVSSVGSLIDGHHRMHAVIKSGVPVVMYVTLGLPHAAYKYLDQGRARGIQDVWGVTKHEKEVIMMCARMVGAHRQPASVGEFINSRIKSTTAELIEYSGTVVKVFSTAGVKTAFVLSGLDYKNRSALFEQYRHLTTRNYLSMTPAVLAFSKQAADMRTCGADQTLDIMCRVLIAIKKGNAPCATLRMNDDIKAELLEWARNVIRQEVNL